MQPILRHTTFAFAALIIWLFASLSGAHSHWCFDGQEPPLSVHMDMLGDHPEHDSDAQHIDSNINAGDAALVKLTKIDLPLLLVATYLLAMLWQTLAVFIVTYCATYPSRRAGLRPPLRAPPVTPA